LDEHWSKMKISKLLVIASLSTLPAVALAQATPGAPADAPKAKAGASVKGEAAPEKPGGRGLEAGAGATPGAGAESGAQQKSERDAPAPASAPGPRTKGEAR
jgi:hypothetical protein